MTAEHLPPTLDIETAADEVALAPRALEALVDAGYLAARRGEDGGLVFDLADLKAFVARNADNGAGSDLLRSFLTQDDHELEPEELVDLLDQRTEAMALRVLKMFSIVFPDAERWTPGQQGAFVRRTKERFESVLAVASVGSEMDDGLYDDLRAIGAAAARSGTQLPELLVLLRMSRDLVVQNAVDLTEGEGRHGGFALSLLLTRILPAIDRLSDALAEGYWAEMFPS
jgi:hypothetical protein